jgi:hypothetical protein
MYATADPRPVSQREAFDFTAEQIDGAFFRAGSGSGHRSPHSDYTWNMMDGSVHSGL